MVGNVLINDTLNTFYLTLCGIRHIVEDLGMLLFSISSNSTDRIAHTTAFVIPVVENWLEWEIVQWVHHLHTNGDWSISFVLILTSDLFAFPPLCLPSILNIPLGDWLKRLPMSHCFMFWSSDIKFLLSPLLWLFRRPFISPGYYSAHWHFAFDVLYLLLLLNLIIT